MSAAKQLYPVLLLVCMFLYTPLLHAQPSNDDPCNAIDLGVFTACSNSTHTTNLATSSGGVTAPGCGNYLGGDVWFQVTMPNNGYHVVVEMTAGTLTDAAMAVYSGPDCNTLSLVSCDDNSGAGNMPTLTIDDGCNFANSFSTFWVRVWDEGNDASGDFDICAYAVTPAVPLGVASCGGNPITGNTCCDAVLLTDQLNGYCGNTGGYTDVPNEITGFCAFIENNAWIAFVANDTEVELELTSFNCDNSMGIQAQILGTNDCTNFSFLSNCWNAGTEATGSLTATGMTPGETYYIMVDGWNGDICDYTITVISGVETTSVTATDAELCSGETTQLFANVYGVGPFTYSWTPTATLSDPTIWNPVASPSASTEYIVTVTFPGGNVIDTIDVIVFDAAPTGATIDGPTNLCQNTVGNIYTCVSPDANSHVWSITGGGTIDGPSDESTIIIDWGTSGGTLCVTPSNECGVGPATCINVNVAIAPNITAADPPVGCGTGGVDLSSIVINNSSGGIGIISYHADASSANAGTPALPSPIVNTTGTYWIRYQTAPDCYDITSVLVTIQDPEIVVVDPAAKCSPNTTDLDLEVWKNEVNGYPGGTYTYYADSLDAANTQSELASTLVSTSGTYWVRYETPEGCFDIVPINVIIDIAPDVSTNETLFICPSDSVDISTVSITDANGATLTGTYYFTNENFAVSGFTVLAMQNTFVTNPGTYYSRYETAAGCWDTAHIVVENALAPDAVISGGGMLCPGELAEVTFTLTGTGPFDIEYTDGPNSFVANGVFSPHVEMLVVNISTNFVITNITDQTGCSGTYSGSADFVINSSPAVTLTGTTDVCGPIAVPLDFNISGTGPFDVVYTDGTSNFTLDDIANGHVEMVTPTATTNYTPVSITDANGCTGAVFGGALVTVNSEIQINNITEICDGSNFNYTVSFELSGGDPSSYSVAGNSGTLDPSTNIFTSDIIASGDSYSFSISDANCGPYTLNGAFACNCITDAGTMDMVGGTKLVCESATATMNYNNDSTLDGDDVLGFVLHEGAGTTLVNPLLFNSTPDFTYDPVLDFEVTYFVSAVAANDDGTGFPVLDSAQDPCLSVAVGQPIIFYQETEASLSAPLTVCEGESVDITFNFTGPGTYNAEYTDGSTTFNLTAISDGHTISVTPTGQVSYELIQVSNTGVPFCTGLVDPATATVTIDLIYPPTVENITTNCDMQNEFYTVSFNIVGGNASGYAVMSGGVLTGNSFVSDPIASGTAYSFEVTDNTCMPNVIVDGSFLCDCTTSVGEMDQTTYHICESIGEVTVTYDDTNQAFDANDVMGFVLHTSDDNTLGTVLMTNTTPTFTFGPPLVFGDTYYISAVVGDDDGTGFPVLDVSQDVCLDVAAGTPVTFHDETEVSISASATTICEGESVDLVFNFSGTALYDLEYTDGTSNYNLTAVSDGHTITVTPDASVTYSVIQVSNSALPFCVGTVLPGQGDVTIDIFEEVIASNYSFVCDELSINYTVTFDISGGNTANYTVSGGAGTLTGNTFTSDPIPGGAAFSFVVSDGGPCPATVSGMEVCNCSPDMTPFLTVVSPVSCNGESDGEVEATPFSGEPPYSYSWSNGQTGSLLSEVAEGWYHVTMTDANNCTAQDSVFVSQPDPLSAELVTESPSCYGDDDGSISVVNINGGTGGYTFELDIIAGYTGNTFSSLEAGTYQVTVFDNSGCEWSESITVTQPDQFMVSIISEDPVIELGDSLTLNVVTNMAYDTLYWTPEVLLSCTSCESQVVYPFETATYTLTAISEDGCVGTDELDVIVRKDKPIYVPNAFSPNGDGTNDYFNVYPGPAVVRISDFKVFTRWGELIFSEEDYSMEYEDEGWDGYFKGQPMSQGVYIYYLAVEYLDGSTETIKGDVTIIK